MGGVRLLLLSDIHANHTALQAVLNDAEKRRYDQVIHLGDALGYGPHPREVLDALRELDAVCVLGNHDDMLLQYADGRRETKDSIVSMALMWQLSRLSERDVAWVRLWRDGIDDPHVGARYRHGTPVSLDDYTDSVPAAREAFGHWQGRLGFVGHTHVPAVYATLNSPVGDWIKAQHFTDGGSYMVPPSTRVILNPGSVGQPRDGNPQASYAVFDTTRAHFEVFRVPYDIERAQEAALEAGLPQVLAARLAIGK
ncbi:MULTISPECIES: metallophosphoesterase [unclassified Deinococcus]|uniref:metallophosphoesterase family protein n=1 Tax=unclassified Deinococcus TaxID=2623546 RepID=UPI000992CFDD|nr:MULTISPECIES: metallophosphoesterase family protein [unclassified Deinococcus]MCD0163664.1 metallophosphoesterase family protein [Deinococcus sp. 6YEL10]MCD0167859.1 metallophosphoesterase family protein [Deinococcus sp. 12RED42]MCD0171533.1 metallophosphoesterase family protein [Deinococcus sp. 23YEL01]PIG98764.1 metallophosphoesterase [Deinococcus sp. UR1]